MVKAIAAELPEQPWPQGIHKVVAEKLNLPVKDVSRAITDLIRDGVFTDQVNGILLPRQENDLSFGEDIGKPNVPTAPTWLDDAEDRLPA